MRSVVAAVFLSLMLASCGTDESKTVMPYQYLEDEPEGNVAGDIDLATPEELDSGEASPGSYLVAFRNNLLGGALSLANYAQEYQAHYLPLAQRFLSDRSVLDINYITALDLRMMSGLTGDRSFSAPASLRLAWSAKDQDSMPTSIARVEFRSPGPLPGAAISTHMPKFEVLCLPPLSY